ncbi:MAG: hypothetical protein JW829_12005 [Pirellulales bacterium]|nr:hypothetical protein [Pirellulales bacterium]
MMRYLLILAVISLILPPQLQTAVAQDSETTPQYRRLAPGVETTIQPQVLPAETVSFHAIPALRTQTDLQWTPKLASVKRTLYEMAGDAEFRRDIWCLEFTFKPLRMLEIDIPQPSGRLQKKKIRYMVYRVKNTGATLHPEQQPGGTYDIKPVAGQPRSFIPQFVLESHERDSQGNRIYKAYLDRIIPSALGPIQQREDPNRQILNSVEMARTPIPPSDDRIDRSVWGVVTWEDVDPRLDFFSIYIAGLSNAYRWTDPEGEYKAGDPLGKGRLFFQKTLQLNFWRPGDDIREDEDEIRFGVPPDKAALYDSPEGVAYQWIYR